MEGFFSKMAGQMLRGIRVESKEELKGRIYKYFWEVNRGQWPAAGSTGSTGRTPWRTSW